MVVNASSLLVGVSICVLCWTGCLAVGPGFTNQRIMKSLLLNYLPGADPGPRNITLKFGVSFISLSLDDSTGELTSKVWKRLSWSDERLVWKPSEFGGVSMIRIPPESIWLPDIILYNSLTATEDYSKTNVVVTNDGSVLWIPPAVCKTQCVGPDKKGIWKCGFKFGSWTYDGFSMPLQEYEKAADISDFSKDNGIDIVSVDSKLDYKYYPCCAEPYPALGIDLYIERFRALQDFEFDFVKRAVEE